MNTITLQDLLNHTGSPLDFAASRGLSLPQLLEWWNSDQTQSQVSDLEALTQTLTRLRANLHAPAAVDQLTSLLTPDNSPTERRRAATVILRHSQHKARRLSLGSPSLREGVGGRAIDNQHTSAQANSNNQTIRTNSDPNVLPLSRRPTSTSSLLSRAGRAPSSA